MRAQGFQFRTEHKGPRLRQAAALPRHIATLPRHIATLPRHVADPTVIKRLLPKPITGESQVPQVSIPECQRKHANAFL